MKYSILWLALPAAILLAVFSAAGRADEIGSRGHSKSGLPGKIEYCTDCHGASGQGYYGFYPIPRLAGQQTEYLENQLLAFLEHRRGNGFAIKMAKVHGLNAAMRAALAGHFRKLNPGPLDDAPSELATKGKKIFEEGVPEANIPACAACHGPEGQGDGANARLAGQLYPYTQKALENWSKERGQNPQAPDTSSIMQPIARSLNKSQVAALAAYVAHLK